MSQTKPSGAIAVFFTFLKLGLTSFGGPIAHLGYFHKELVVKQRWVSESHYSQLLALCQFLPGPASSQLGFALGYLRAGWLGALAAFCAFTLPSALLLIAFASSLPFLSGELGSALISGLKIVALAVVADAVLGMAKKLCPDTVRKSIAMLAILILLLFSSAWMQIAVIALGALLGVLLCRDMQGEQSGSPKVGYSGRLAALLFGIFLLLLLSSVLLLGENRLIAVASSFYQAGALVFGGGHVVLPLLEDLVVNSAWLNQEQFLAGYGAAQAIPGPMFSFAAYLGALIPTTHSTWMVALVALLFMFLPGFLLVSAVLPIWQKVSQDARATRAIAGVNAAVVGLLAAALYDPIFISSVNAPIDLVIGLVAFAMLVLWRLSALWIVCWCVLASVLLVFI